MKYLLDTHAFIWCSTDDSKLFKSLGDDIEDNEKDYFLSVASLWEIGIKHSLRKLVLKIDIIDLFKELKESKIQVLPIASDHILKQVQLPLHHRDPFDRLLIAQAQVENLAILTKNSAFKLYQVSLKWN
jgi:PIN domain nuclease of toxin-antitoxin system